mmetsp:Transcript_75137/g.151043  ORF Transcript_75137/g.151043 Transcript_75137/m.151043 type:complete len:136 (+) Transcript_75137:69-476(+)
MRSVIVFGALIQISAAFLPTTPSCHRIIHHHSTAIPERSEHEGSVPTTQSENQLEELGYLTSIYKEREAQRLAEEPLEEKAVRRGELTKAESINGRLAMVAFVAMAARELVSGVSFQAQLGDLIVSIGQATDVLV